MLLLHLRLGKYTLKECPHLSVHVQSLLSLSLSHFVSWVSTRTLLHLMPPAILREGERYEEGGEEGGRKRREGGGEEEGRRKEKGGMREKRERGWRRDCVRKVGGRMEEREEEEEEREEGVSKGGRRRWREGVRQVVEHTVTVHVEDKNDLLIPSSLSPFSSSLPSLPPLPSLPFLPSPSLPSLPPLPFLPPLSHQLHKSSTSIYMTPARDETSLYAQFRAIKIKTDLKRCSQVCCTYS